MVELVNDRKRKRECGLTRPGGFAVGEAKRTTSIDIDAPRVVQIVGPEFRLNTVPLNRYGGTPYPSIHHFIVRSGRISFQHSVESVNESWDSSISLGGTPQSSRTLPSLQALKLQRSQTISITYLGHNPITRSGSPDNPSLRIN
ncbi:predicted protein [Histoplasma capsulatum H143]|uniref:Uncharacterized protein n=1 Tax=Ajellomyces capsulatus (strain H143) TaxID=544712 RepID=C6H847_AJECH|nr:predicted protein [Histoplasma capsulatum H143]